MSFDEGDHLQKDSDKTEQGTQEVPIVVHARSLFNAQNTHNLR